MPPPFPWIPRFPRTCQRASFRQRESVRQWPTDRFRHPQLRRRRNQHRHLWQRKRPKRPKRPKRRLPRCRMQHLWRGQRRLPRRRPSRPTQLGRSLRVASQFHHLLARPVPRPASRFRHHQVAQVALPPVAQVDTRHHPVAGHNRLEAHPAGHLAPVALPADPPLVAQAVQAAEVVLVVPLADDLRNARVGVVVAAKSCSR